MPWHDFRVLLIQLFPEDHEAYDFEDIAEIINDSWLELHGRVNGRNVAAVYRSLRRRTGTRDIVAPIDLKERPLSFCPKAARRIASFVVKRRRPSNVCKVAKLENHLAREKASRQDKQRKSDSRRT